VLFLMLAATPFACEGTCPPPEKAALVAGEYKITQANDDPDLVGGTITLTTDTLTVSFERVTGPVEVVYEIGEQLY
jgi:hypothetical protein